MDSRYTLLPDNQSVAGLLKITDKGNIMNEEKKDLQLEKELLSCGFTPNDVVKIYEAADSPTPRDVIKRVRVLSSTSIVMFILIIVTMTGMIWTLDSDEYFMTDIISSVVVLVLMALVINYMMPFKIGVKATLFLIKLNKNKYQH